MRRELKRLVVGMALMGGLGLGCKTFDSAMGKDEQKYPLQISHNVPAAEGVVKVKPEDGDNQKVTIDVEHIAPPDMAVQGSSAYVVWLKPQGSSTSQNVGTLVVDKDRKAHFETSTAFKSFDVMVTAEESPQAKTPSGQSVLKAAVKPQQAGTY